jgi:hypothetical protein
VLVDLQPDEQCVANGPRFHRVGPGERLAAVRRG